MNIKHFSNIRHCLYEYKALLATEMFDVNPLGAMITILGVGELF